MTKPLFEEIKEGDLVEDVFDGIPHQVMIVLPTGAHMLQIGPTGRVSAVFLGFEYINAYFRKLTALPNNGATTPEYWDCNCALAYINPKMVDHCGRCGADYSSHPQDFPDSRMSEVAAAGFHIAPSLREKELERLASEQ